MREGDVVTNEEQALWLKPFIMAIMFCHICAGIAFPFIGVFISEILLRDFDSSQSIVYILSEIQEYPTSWVAHVITTLIPFGVMAAILWIDTIRKQRAVLITFISSLVAFILVFLLGFDIIYSVRTSLFRPGPGSSTSSIAYMIFPIYSIGIIFIVHVSTNGLESFAKWLKGRNSS